MSRKNESDIILSAEDHQQVQTLLTAYHQVAQDLHQSIDSVQAETALASFNALPEAAQLAVLKALTKETESDAADILIAIYTFSPHKEIRKEARRSLIRLETARVYPQWTPPNVHTPAIQVNTANPPRFWKGLVTQSRDQGEIQLILLWEQGYDYTEVRQLSFLLDYWQEGVKEVFVETLNKRRTNERLNEWRTRLHDIALVDCTPAEGKRLIEEALSVNAWRATPVHKDYQNNLPIINSLLMQASDIGKDSGNTFINPELTDQEVVINFLGAWSLSDYGLAYDLLSRDSHLHEGLSREEWIERHRAWATEARPARLELGFVREQEVRQSALWLPTSARSVSPRKEISIGWSLEMAETPLSGTLPEMPMGTAVNKETGRHWFWTSYTVVQEQKVWRIQRFSDEGARVQGLPIPELQRQIEEYEKAIDARIKQRDTDVQAFMEELPWRITQLLHLSDALIARLPFDRQVCESAYNSSVAMGNPERTMVYLERISQRFPERRGDVLRSLAATQIAYAYSDRTQYLPDRRKHFLAQAETTLQEAIQIDDSLMNHILLAELFISTQRNEEAEAELHKAQNMHPGTEEEVAIEAGLGNIAMRRERYSEAIPHFQRVANLQPQSPGIWFNLGFAHRLLGQFPEAENYYKQAVQREPQDTRVYTELIAIYMNRSDKQAARTIAEQGVRTNPDSAPLHALFASVLYELGDLRAAQRQLEDAEAIDPELEIVQSVRQQLNTNREKKK
jgi:Tfp pilus assembly protein PilF